MIPKNTWWFAFISLFLLLSPAFLHGQATAGKEAEVPGVILARRVIGRVVAVDKQSRAERVLSNDSRVSAADLVRTATEAPSSVVLVFSNGMTVQLKHGSELDVDSFMQQPWDQALDLGKLETEPGTSHTKLNLVKGELIGKVPKLKKGASTLQIHTPVGVAGIRGTTFRIVLRADPARPGMYLFELNTSEGLVVFEGSAPGATPVSIGANQQITLEVELRVDPATGRLVPASQPSLPQRSEKLAPEPLRLLQEATLTAVGSVQDLVLVPYVADQQAPAGEPDANEKTEGSESGTQPGQDPQSSESQKSEGGTSGGEGGTQDAAPPSSNEAPASAPPQPASPPRVTSGEGL